MPAIALTWHLPAAVRLSSETALCRRSASAAYAPYTDPIACIEFTMAQANGQEKPGTAAEGLGVAKGGWFTEVGTMWPGQGLSIKVDDILFQERSKFQVKYLNSSKKFEGPSELATLSSKMCSVHSP